MQLACRRQLPSFAADKSGVKLFHHDGATCSCRAISGLPPVEYLSMVEEMGARARRYRTRRSWRRRASDPSRAACRPPQARDGEKPRWQPRRTPTRRPCARPPVWSPSRARHRSHRISPFAHPTPRLPLPDRRGLLLTRAVARASPHFSVWKPEP
ncbi:hypothetical protein PAHAL_3G185000 [Panicum hallii]|uniref:Uncharacterized protein n=1 Tax=Panicum hallii TaxID=206008 RepID=A0A2T8KIM9_9POAL|nr:hypothetical protein PAHAL_3G185000 [Panicum hallii]